LRNPDKFTKVGAVIPKGVLLYGPPGTGKTLLARAIAGEAGVPFLYISGADFVEVFVGIGASRVRDLFTQAKKIGRCIIFIDELDSIGRKRSAYSTNDEREATLNQFLVELDGFDSNTGVIVIGATNRSDVLDPALLRPGRFDRLIPVSLPDAKGRAEILRVHLAKVKIDPLNGIALRRIKSISTGMSGAQLANIVNEAAIIAAREGRSFVTTQDLLNALEGLILGVKSSLVLKEKDREITAYHEAGHAVVSYTEGSEILKATIVSTTKSLGHVANVPEEKYSFSLKDAMSRIRILMAGRAGEELRFGKDHITSGASHDISQATSIADDMIKDWGMSSLGMIKYSSDDAAVSFRFAPNTIQAIDAERAEILNGQYQIAKTIIEENKLAWERIALALLAKETLTGNEVEYLMKNDSLDGLLHADPSKLEDEDIYMPGATSNSNQDSTDSGDEAGDEEEEDNDSE